MAGGLLRYSSGESHPAENEDQINIPRVDTKEPKLTVQNPDGFARILQSFRDGPEIAAAIHVPLYIIVFTGRSKTTEAVLGGRLAGTILGVGLRVDGGTNFLSEVVTEFGNGTLDLIQEPAYFILLRRVFLVLGLLLILLLLLRGRARALATVSIGVLILILSA